MPAESWTGRASDEDLVEIARDGSLSILGGGDEHKRGGLKDIASELLRLRRILRGDSRRAEQLKKLRWTMENMLAKIEAVGKAGAADEVLDLVRVALNGCGCKDPGCIHARILAEIGPKP